MTEGGTSAGPNQHVDGALTKRIAILSSLPIRNVADNYPPWWKLP
jgi:hypothetical protein